MLAVTVYLVVDSDGNAYAATDRETARQAYEDECGDTVATVGIRWVELLVNVPIPKALTAVVTVPDDVEDAVSVA